MKRIKAAVIDFLISLAIIGILGIIFIYTKQNFYLVETGQLEINVLAKKIVIIIYIGFLYLLFRDVSNKGSIGKRIFKLKIIDTVNYKEASISKKILRNLLMYIFCIINITFIIIIFLILYNKGNRIGDLIFKTKVVEKEN